MRKDNPGNEPNVPKPENMRYESGDLALPVILKWMAGFFAFSLLSGGVTFAIYVVMLGGQKEEASSLGPGKRLPPAPVLQNTVTAKQDIADLRARERQVLDGFGWADKDLRTVRIPVSRAIELTAQRGLANRVEGVVR